MKKLLLPLLILCLVLASCGGNQTPVPTSEPDAKEAPVKGKCCKEMTEEQKKECAEFKEKWENWANLTDVEKKELIVKKKECLDKKMAKMKEHEAEMEAKKAEMEAQLAIWDKMTVDEQKAFFDKMSECCQAKKCCGNKKGCDGHKEKEGCGHKENPVQ